MKAKQFFYAMIVSTVLGFGGIVVAFYWGDIQLNKEANIISNLQTDRDIAREKIIILKKAQKSTDNLEEASRILDVLLPTIKSQETLIADILYTATFEAGIPSEQISTLSFTKSKEPTNISGTEQFKEVPGVLSYPFSLAIIDIDYPTLLKLLKEIESNGRLVQVADLKITPDESSPGYISSVALTMKAFLKP